MFTAVAAVHLCGERCRSRRRRGLHCLGCSSSTAAMATDAAVSATAASATNSKEVGLAAGTLAPPPRRPQVPPPRGGRFCRNSSCSTELAADTAAAATSTAVAHSTVLTSAAIEAAATTDTAAAHSTGLALPAFTVGPPPPRQPPLPPGRLAAITAAATLAPQPLPPLQYCGCRYRLRRR